MLAARTGVVLALLVACSGGACMSANVPELHRRAAETITEEQLRRDVHALAADSMRGRWTPSPELEAAAGYLSARLRRAGLRPGGDQGSYLQRFPIDVFQLLLDSAAVWTTGSLPMRWTHGEDFGFAFNTWANWDAAGRAVLLRGSVGARANFDTAALAGTVLFIPGGWGRNYDRVAAWRPAGVIWLDDVPSATLARMARPRLRPTRRAPGDTMPLVLMSYRAAATLAARAGVDTTGIARAISDTILQAIPLGDAVVHIRGRVRHLPHENPANVVAFLEGADPALRGESLVYSAHYDHLGISAAVDGDSINNGADDNASGTAAVLAVAEAFARMPTRPRRSVVFAFVAAEEFLGLGARHFLDHPPVPVSSIVANLNADMVGRNWSDTVLVIGRRDSDLGLVVGRVLAAHPELALAATDSSTRPNEARNLEGWSDHAAFIRKGIPFLYFYSGMHADYHRPSDSADKIGYEKLTRISRLLFHTGLAVANAGERPRWNEESFRRLVPRR